MQGRTGIQAVVVVRTTEREYGVVVEQLERERQEASRRSHRLQEKLKELQKERDAALKKAAEYKTKLAEAKEAARKEVTSLQARLSKVRRLGAPLQDHPCTTKHISDCTANFMTDLFCALLHM